MGPGLGCTQAGIEEEALGFRVPGLRDLIPKQFSEDPVARAGRGVTRDWHGIRREGIRTVLWATGFRRKYPWLHIPVLDNRGEIRHAGGVTPEPGLYVLGLRFLRRRNSSFIDGQAKDAAEIADHISALRGSAHLAYA